MKERPEKTKEKGCRRFHKRRPRDATRKAAKMPKGKNTYVTLHKNFVRTDIEYADRVTGETRTFNSVTLPKGTVIDGNDVSYYQFSPMFVNESRFHSEDYRDIPLLTDREVWLKRSVLDADGQPILDEDGKPEKDVVKVMPAQIKEAVDRNRTEYLQSLQERAGQAREGAQNLGNDGGRASVARDDIPF